MLYKLKRISIITPSYNSSSFIEDCIQSVLNQNYPNFEHIIIDGASTDGTVEILKKYLHLKWISEPDEGQSDALNKGFKMATGEIIGWCNSDDVYCKDTFTKVVDTFDSNNFIDGIYSDLYIGGNNLEIYKKLKSHKSNKWISLLYCFIPSATFFIKKEAFNGFYFSVSKNITMDKDLFARLLFANKKLMYVKECFAIFRWHTNNKSLDNKETKRARIIESLNTISLILNIKIPINNISISIYFLLMYAILPIRSILRWLSK